MLRDLRAKLKPDNAVHKNILTKKWKQLQHFPSSKDIEDWVNEYETYYDKLVSIGYFNASGSNVVEEFIDLLPDSSFRSWASQQISGGEELEMHNVLMRFRQDVVKSKAKSSPRGKSAFSNPRFQGKTPDDNDSDPKKNQSRYPNNKCEGCDIKGHELKDCFWVFEEKRPSTWRHNLEKEKQILDKIRNDPTLSGKIKNLRTKSAHVVMRPMNSNNHTDQPDSIPNPVAHYISSEYELRDSVLLDSGASDHVTNDRTRFRTYRIAHEGDFLWSGNTKVPVAGYGTMVTYGTNPLTSRRVEIKVEDAVHAPTFHTSLVSLRKMRKKGYKWDMDSDCLTTSTKIVCEVLDKFELYLIEYNKLPEQPKMQTAYPTTTSKPKAASRRKPISRQEQVLQGTMDMFHVRFGHISPEVIRHLPTALKGIKIIGPKNPKRDNEFQTVCSVCAASRLQKIISRRPFPLVSRPYERVHVDLIVLNPPAYNGAKYALHSCDAYSKYHDLFPIRSKQEVRSSLDQLDAKLKRQYGLEIMVIHIDGEWNINSNDAIQWALDKGYEVETTAVDSPEQNGLAERSGGVVGQRARAFHIEAKLPKNLWSESYTAAVYIINRLPTKSLDWKTPYEVLRKAVGLVDTIPRAAHIRAYGCAAYYRDTRVDQGDKIQPRCLIGYLVGYESSTVYRIWNPKTNRVVRARDVWFDKTKFYNPDDPYDLIKVPEKVKPMRLTLKLPELAKLLDEIDIDSDEDIEEIGNTGEHGTVDITVQEAEKNTAPNTEPSHGIPTPEQTPEPTGFHHPSQGTERLSESMPDSTSGNRAPRAMEIGADLSKDNIIEGSRTRRRQAHHAAIQDPGQLIGFISAFTVGLSHQRRLHKDEMLPSPENYRALQNHRFRQQYLDARHIEWTELNNRGTFEEVEKPPGIKTIPVKWVDEEKYDKDGYLIKFKSRLVARGDLQPKSLQDTYAATLTARVFRFMMALAATYDLDVEQLDAINAFINSPINELIYIELPDGYKKDGRCLRLLRALYGLKQSPRLWQKELKQFLTSLPQGFKQMGDEPCAYTDGRLIILFFVDDILLLNQKKYRKERDEFKRLIMAKYPMRDLGPVQWFLGIRIVRDRDNRCLSICQDSYIKSMLVRYHLDGSKSASIPLPPEKLDKYDQNATKEQIHQYQQKVGSIMYAAVMTRPDIACAASKLCEHLQNPSPKHLDAVDHVIRYLGSTSTLAIQYSRSYHREIELAIRSQMPDVFTVASDAAFADNPDRRSTQGYVIKLFGGPIDWKSGKQATVTTSTTEAERLALSRAAQETYWWKRMFGAVDFEPDHNIYIACDNKQTVDSMNKEDIELKTKMKHVDIYNHWLRQEAQKGQINIKWVPTNEMPADGLTKLLPRQKHQDFKAMLNLRDIEHQIDVSNDV
jgi:hypothetical protein